MSDKVEHKDDEEIDWFFVAGRVIGYSWIAIKVICMILICIAGFLIAFCSVVTKNQP